MNYNLKKREIRRKEKKKIKLTKFEEIKKHIKETFPDIKIEYSFDDKNKLHQGSFEHPNRSAHRSRYTKYPLRRASWAGWNSYALGWNLLGSPLQKSSLLTGLNSELNLA